MNYCPNCGSKLESGHNFCPNCGQKPRQEKVEKTQRKTSSKNNSWVIPVSIVLLIIAIGAIVSGVIIGLQSGDDTSSNSNAGNYYQPTYYPTYTYQPPQPTYTPTQHILLSNETILGGYHSHTSYVIPAGKTVTLSWSADGYVSAYILTENQYDYFSFYGFHSSPAAYDSGSSGTLSYYVANTDTYYLVLSNSNLFQNVKVYSATASW